MRLITITEQTLDRPEVSRSPVLGELCRSTVAGYPSEGPVRPWVGYLAAVASEFVGACAFKAPADEKGVEIAFHTFLDYEGRGYATAMVRCLVAIARNAQATAVRAQTPPQASASTHILARLGFRRIGVARDGEDGELWQWQLQWGWR